MKLNGNKTAVYERIAKLAFDEVPDEQIADVIGCSVAQLREWEQDPDYKKIYAELIVEKHEHRDLRNSGWDDLEAEALGHLLDQIDIYKGDAEFLLKTAMLANKAQRRQSANQPINGQAAQMTAVLHLQPQFVQVLQNYSSGDRPGREITQKSQDFLDVGKVEEILGFTPGPEMALKER